MMPQIHTVNSPHFLTTQFWSFLKQSKSYLKPETILHYIDKGVYHDLFLTVSGQNTICIYITPLVLIQPTDAEHNAVNNCLLKLQLAVMLQSWQKSTFTK